MNAYLAEKSALKIFDLDRLIASLQGYIETKVELVKLDAKEELQSVITKFLVLSLLVILVLLTVVFFSIGLAYFLNDLLGSNIWGFAIVGLLYLLSSILVFSNKDRILKKIDESIKAND